MLLSNRCQVAIKKEAVPGTAETLAAANVVMTTELPVWTPDVSVKPRKVLSASLDERGVVPTTRAAKIDFKMALRGTTGAPVDPTNLSDYVVPFKGCGLDVVVSGGAGSEICTSTPGAGSPANQCSLAIYRDGKQYLVHGASGNLKITLVAATFVLLEFSFMGLYNTPTDVALLAPTYPTVVEPVFKDGALTILGFATPKAGTITLDLGNKIALRPSPNGPTGYFTAQITDREPVITIDPEEELAATKNWWNEFILGTTGSIDTGSFPSTGAQYNKFQITAPKCQYTKGSQSDRDGIAVTSLDVQPRANTDGGNDAFSITQR